MAAKKPGRPGFFVARNVLSRRRAALAPQAAPGIHRPENPRQSASQTR